MGWSEDAASNRTLWTKSNEEYSDGQAAERWASDASWGMWHHAESELQLLGSVGGLDAVELGCGTAYVSAWLARDGARPVGVDVTPAQLATARRCQLEFGLEFPLVEADAAETGFPGAGFDLVVSEYGASIWDDPHRWVPEAARLLRPGGPLVFLRNSLLVILSSPDEGAADDRLHRAQRGLRRLTWPGEEGVEFHIAHGEWIDVLRTNGFEVERLIELFAREGAHDHEYYNLVKVHWAKQWPAEEIWVARKRG